MLRIRIQDKGPAAAFHRCDVPGKDAAPARLLGAAEEAGRAGFLAAGLAGLAGVLRAPRGTAAPSNTRASTPPRKDLARAWPPPAKGPCARAVAPTAETA